MHLSRNFSLFLALVFLCNILSCAAFTFYLNCDDNPCKHGQCTDLYRKTAYRCDCDDGWEGENCDKEIGKEDKPSGSLIVNKPSRPDPKPTPTQKDTMPMDYCADVVCENGGTCDRRTGKCRCTQNYDGDFCQFDSEAIRRFDKTHNNKFLPSLEECNFKCTKDTVISGQLCHYSYIDSKESCICNSTDLIGGTPCKPVKKEYSMCQDECQHHLTADDTDFLNMENNLRTCRYFAAPTDTEILKCTCTTDAISCKNIIENEAGQGNYSFVTVLIVVVLFVAFKFAFEKICKN